MADPYTTGQPRGRQPVRAGRARIYIGAPDEPESTTDVAKSEAAAVKDTAVDAGKEVASTAKEEAVNVASEVKDQAKGLLSTATSELQSQASTQQGRTRLDSARLRRRAPGIGAGTGVLRARCHHRPGSAGREQGLGDRGVAGEQGTRRRARGAAPVRPSSSRHVPGAVRAGRCGGRSHHPWSGGRQHQRGLTQPGPCRELRHLVPSAPTTGTLGYEEPTPTYGAYADAPAGYPGDAGWSTETSVPAGYPDQGQPTR